MKRFLTVFIILCICLNFYKIEAETLEGGIILETTKQTVQKNEEFTISVQTKNLVLGACNIALHFDQSLVEIVSIPENTNVLDDVILYTWYDEQGGKSTDANITLVELTFKAKENGLCIFTIYGDFYNQNEQEIIPNIRSVEVKIGEEKSYTEIDMQILEENKSDDVSNTELAILRLNQEGINPIFQPNIKEYYITIEEEIRDLEITAIPQNQNSKVTIMGNTNLNNGLNQISIKVTSEDKSKDSEYKIYATRTNDKERANANLENLAIENIAISPEFSEEITNYNAEIENNIENLNLLAIPQVPNAKVEVKGENNLKVGTNNVEIIVTAENEQTFKKYQINVKRLSVEETEEKLEQTYNNLKQIEARNLELIDNSKEIEEVEQEKTETEIIKNIWIIVGIIVAIAVIGIIILQSFKHKLRKNVQ